jgi:hypothetical protein
MTKRKPPETPKVKLTPKQKLWLKAYLNRDNPSTFLNKSESARAAGYNCTELSYGPIGHQNFKKLKIHIDKWLDEEGLGENQLKSKLIMLIEARQITFHKVKGRVDPNSLPPGAFIVAESNILGWSGNGEDKQAVDEGDTVIAVPMSALETQRKSLEMAMKVKGMFAPEKHEHKHSVDPWGDLLDAVTKTNSDELPNRGN